MKDDSHRQSVNLFFQTFSRHLEAVRDGGESGRSSFRAQILLSQLHQFEKAMLERTPGEVRPVEDVPAFRALLQVIDFDQLVTWICKGQRWAHVQDLFFLNQDGHWELLAGKGSEPPSLNGLLWVERGLLAKLEPSDAFAAYLFGQPRLIFRFNPGDEAFRQRQAQFSTFVARLLPLFIHQPVRVPAKDLPPVQGLIAQDRGFIEVLTLIQKAAQRDVNILLEGESGTGKEIIANFIHQHSTRRGKPLVVVNCAAIPSGLIESELFGHEKGSFTGAYARQIGRVEEADGGTLFLDEIGEMELAMQAKLLRFLQLREFHRVGGKQKVSVNVRIVAATNRNLKNLVAAHAFREDLYYRLSVMPFSVPALRERIDDILPLTRHFLAKYAQKFGIPVPEVDGRVFQILATYPFPGNVRELENLVQNILVVSQGNTILARHLPGHLRKLESKGVLLSGPHGKTLTWSPVARQVRSFRKRPLTLARKRAVQTHPESWLETMPKDNGELKALKQQIQAYAARLTLELEHRFLKNLLSRAEGSMPRASELGHINRTLLYKIAERTKHLDADEENEP